MFVYAGICALAYAQLSNQDSQDSVNHEIFKASFRELENHIPLFSTNSADEFGRGLAERLTTLFTDKVDTIGTVCPRVEDESQRLLAAGTLALVQKQLLVVPLLLNLLSQCAAYVQSASLLSLFRGYTLYEGISLHWWQLATTVRYNIVPPLLLYLLLFWLC